MSYYPILKAPDCNGWTTLSNFSPNNWEVRNNTSKYINVSWAENDVWHTRHIDDLEIDGMRTITDDDVKDIVPAELLAFLSLTTDKQPEKSKTLPVDNNARTTVPEWRATLGLSSQMSSVSYQGEINPFPCPGSLLSFGPFFQFEDHIENYLIFLNLSKSAVQRKAKVELYTADNTELRKSFSVASNDITAIPLDDLGFNKNDLPLIICREMSAIPLFFSKTKNGSHLSLEHTHPPASFVVHGKRFDAQKIIKNLWFSRTDKE